MNKLEINVLFVCLGNICRSPTAQAVFETQVRQAGLQNSIRVDSCGTAAYHIGKAPDSRSISAAEKRGYAMQHLRARKLEVEDFSTFDYILTMDEENLLNTQALAPDESQAVIALYMDFSAEQKTDTVPDPYYGGADGFKDVLDLVEGAGAGLLDTIKDKYFN